MKIDLLHIILVSENGRLINDSTEKSVMRNYIMDALKADNMTKLDTMIKIVMANKSFFMGMDKKDVKSLIGNWASASIDDLTYKWGRMEMQPPTEKVILFFRFVKFKVVYMEAPYSAYCCILYPDRPKWLLKHYMKRDPATFPPGKYGL